MRTSDRARQIEQRFRHEEMPLVRCPYQGQPLRQVREVPVRTHPLDGKPLRCHHGSTLCWACHYFRLQAILRRQQ